MYVFIDMTKPYLGRCSPHSWPHPPPLDSPSDHHTPYCRVNSRTWGTGTYQGTPAHLQHRKC